MYTVVYTIYMPVLLLLLTIPTYKKLIFFKSFKHLPYIRYIVAIVDYSCMDSYSLLQEIGNSCTGELYQPYSSLDFVTVSKEHEVDKTNSR